MAKSKKIKLETIGEQAKNKKDFLIIISIVSILTFLAISIGMAFLSSDKKKVYKKRQEAVLNQKSLELIPERDFKENWAISVENNLEKQNKLLLEFMKKTKEDFASTKEELKNMIIDSSASQKELIQQNAKIADKKITELRNYLEDSLEKQNNRIEELSIMRPGTGINMGENGDDESIELGSDLLPPLPKIEKKVESKDDVADSIESIIGDSTKSSGVNISNTANNVKGNSATDSKSEKAKPQLQAQHISLVDIDTEENQQIIKKEEKRIAMLTKEKEQAHSYHVMVGLSRAYMITGAYAPVFSAGEEEPLPVLLQAEGDILIANDDVENVDRCLLIGSAKGNMNSKTADIRLVKISCSLNDGKQMIEGAISGWVIGENGIPGVPGELLHKNGAWLAQTFVAGFMQTFSDALSNTGTTQIAIGGTTGGTATDIPVGQAVTDNAASAVGGGLSTVFGKLGEYYLKMAEQIFPVIEVKAGRTVNILLRGGEDLQVKDLHKVDIGEIEEEYEQKELDKQEALENSMENVYNTSTTNQVSPAAKTAGGTNNNDILITE